MLIKTKIAILINLFRIYFTFYQSMWCIFHLRFAMICLIIGKSSHIYVRQRNAHATQKANTRKPYVANKNMKFT